MKFTVVLQKHDEGYTVTCPSLPGCISEGNTESESLDNIKDAIHEYLSVLRDETGAPTPPQVEIAIREVEVPA